MLRAHGSKRKYHNEVLGYNSRLDALQAALLRVKLPHVDKQNQGRRAVAKRYNQLLADVKGVITPQLVDGHVFHQYTIRITNTDRDEVQKGLKEAGVGSMIYYPISQDQLPVYTGEYPQLPITRELTNQVLSLPIWPTLDEDVQRRVVEALNSALN